MRIFDPRFLSRLFGVSFTAMLLHGCTPPAEKAAPPPPTVTVAPVAERSIQDFVIFTGRTEPAETVEIRARVSGYLAETRFKDGQMVKKGDVLFVIDPRPYQADLDRATGEYKRAEAEVQLASVEFNRARELRQKDAISAQDFDAKSAALLKAQATMASARAAMDTAKLNLEFTSIVSPIEGRAGRASVTPGNLVTPDMKQPLTTVVSISPVYAYANLDERQLLRYLRMNNQENAGTGDQEASDPKKDRDDVPIQLQLADEKSFAHTGIIDFADNRVNRETGTLEVRGVFSDPDGVIAPGMFVRLRFPAGARYTTLLVPQEAIGIDQGRRFVYIIGSDGTVESRGVEPGSLQDDGWRAVKGELKAGEQVVVEGQIKIRPGIKVRTQPWNAPSPPDGSQAPATTIQASESTEAAP